MDVPLACVAMRARRVGLIFQAVHSSKWRRRIPALPADADRGFRPSTFLFTSDCQTFKSVVARRFSTMTNALRAQQADRTSFFRDRSPGMNRLVDFPVLAMREAATRLNETALENALVLARLLLPRDPVTVSAGASSCSKFEWTRTSRRSCEAPAEGAVIDRDSASTIHRSP
jgi:hypothetical protein